ncbi:Leu/Phe/Val dehydrogenase [Aliamphritea hakodatensis]|uniref:Leu/Phe/Val dehydrogenase n=1 Tax=Aliamphritea hakodatensis TaxID=2895352 RepID=UPI0022FD6DD3|nr:Glu/Leu/Phe/Val dehydrogenase dimerization domain-containing protein [Aliamphritea hakodatensis]
MFKQMETDALEQLHFFSDPGTGLRAVIAIHSTVRGPALGGCRFIPYSTNDDAITDAIRLAKGMSYKAALAGLPFGGGKAVIIRPDNLNDRHALMRSFGQAIDSLSGQYITAMDSGTLVDDMDDIATRTSYVSCTQQMGDPSPATARGVFAGIRANLQYTTGSDSLKGRHIAIQGLGHVGLNLAFRLRQAGAHLTVTDIDDNKMLQARQQLSTAICRPEEIYDVSCDVFSPCGLGAVINDDTLPRLRCKSIAGSANNQLKTPAAGLQLKQRNILYAPDYVINAGGLMFVAMRYQQQTDTAIEAKITGIFDTLSDLYMEARQSSQVISDIADQRASEIIQQADSGQFQAA